MIHNLTSSYRGALLCASLVPAALLSQERADQKADVRLLRCEQSARVVCAEMDVRIPSEFAASRDDSAGAAWTLNLGRQPFFGPVTTQRNVVDPPVHLLVLLDVSGSMIGSGMAYTRQALRTFLKTLPATGVQVAVAPFGSRAVEATIRAAVFTTPEKAVQQLDVIPAPARSANTALYSAVRAGAMTVARSAQSSPIARRILLLITDGKNEVGGANDDRDLLPNDSLVAATQAVANEGVHLIALGVGAGVLRGQLDSLAAESGKSYIIALDPVRLGEQFDRINLEVADRRTLTFGARADLSAFGRILRRANLHLAEAGGGKEETVAVSWTPPLIALPAFTGAANSSAFDGSFRDVVASLSGVALERWIYVVVMFVASVALWGLVPRWIWPPVLIERAVVREQGEDSLTSATTQRSGDDSGLRVDAKEAAPRSPSDVTGEFPITR
jgi:hypothetical protein